jgi:hypothetical protein
VVGVQSDETPTGRRVDFFVSHAGRDQAWAEWLAWQLLEAGYSVELDVWDWTPGQDFVTRMGQALARADRLVAVWSEAYFRSAFGGAELRAAFVRQAQDNGRIVPVLVEPIRVPELYASLIYVDLTGLDEATAAARLRERLAGQRPEVRPRFPVPQPSPAVLATVTPSFAGRLPAVWNVPPRNPHFVGRSEMLSELRARLRSGEHTVAVQALHGLGGVGKTQLAIEYAHRFAADYELVWWLDAEQSALLAGQLAIIAGPLGLPAGDSVRVTVDRVKEELRRRSSWLLIFDNAQRPQDLLDYQPGGDGHVLATSRYPGWGGLGGRLEVDVLVRPETVTLLRRRLAELDEEMADELAEELGDLPLAAAQAAGYLESTGLPPSTYLQRFRTRRGSLLASGDVVGYEGRLDTAWALSLERLGANSPAAVQLLQLAAFLAPEPIPLRLFSDHADVLGKPLRTVAADPDELDDVVGLIVGFSLARRQGDRIQLHRLVQAVICHHLTLAEQQVEQARALSLLAAAHPGDLADPDNWSSYEELTPHVLATSALGDGRSDSRQLVLNTVRYLDAKGDSLASRDVATPLLDRWRRTLGSDHPDTLSAAVTLSFALTQLDQAEPARQLGEDTVKRARRVLGRNHPTTLFAAATQAGALCRLADLTASRALTKHTLQQSRRALGPDHPTTLAAACTLACVEAGRGEVDLARQVGERTLARCRRVLGKDHLVTLTTETAVTFALVVLVDPVQAVTLSRDLVGRCRRVFGPDHMLTLFADATLTLALLKLRKSSAARTMGEKTLAMCRHALGPDNPTTLLAAATLTLAYVQLGDAEHARALVKDILDRGRRALSPDHVVRLLAAAALTSLSLGQGDVGSASVLVGDRVEHWRRMLRPDHPTTRFIAQITGIGVPASAPEREDVPDSVEPRWRPGVRRRRRCNSGR